MKRTTNLAIITFKIKTTVNKDIPYKNFVLDFFLTATKNILCIKNIIYTHDHYIQREKMNNNGWDS